MKQFTTKLSLYFTALVLSALIAGGTFFVAKTTNAITDIPFGGRITYVVYCTCSESILVYVGPPRPGAYVYQPGATQLYSFYQIYRTGPWVLGTATAGGVCLVYAGTGCASIPNEGTMQIVGTSLE